ncbi:universal stress protein A-like protein [Canna indica]|uniref:Universal stress protein A-like protein n=1 Tax=Canna indica TaxID=4628 RepID=A0AAQ3JVG0_9LILI|nr:universal stress protein A-like protein [Canna indica]
MISNRRFAIYRDNIIQKEGERERERERERETMESSSNPPTQIMIGVNQSSLRGYPHPSISSRTAFEWTVQKIVRSNAAGFKFLFLHVQIPDEDGFDDMDSIFASPDDFKRMNQKEKIRGLDLLQYFVECAHQFGIQCEAWIKKGDPKEVICQEVKRLQPDMLVVGSRGLGPFQRVFVGTVSEFCAKHAECPVITIKRKADEAPQDPIDD